MLSFQKYWSNFLTPIFNATTKILLIIFESVGKLLTHFHILTGKVRVNFTLEQATKVQRGIRSIALLFL